MTAPVVMDADRERLEQALLDAATAAFEAMSFTFASDVLDDDQAAAPVDCVATVTFDGPCRGVLALVLCGDVLAEIAANMLGEDGAPTRDVQRDALGELANVVCGNVTPHLAGASAVFSLGAPVVRDDASALPLGEPAARRLVGVELGRAELSLWVEDA
jgi:CheY-specific phosphatase CheX